MTEGAGATGLEARRLRLWIWTAIALLFLTLSGAGGSTGALDDDNLWLAYLSVTPTAQAKTIERQLIDRTAKVDGCSIEAFRFSLRERYGANYAGYIGLNNVVYRAMERVEGQGPNAAVRALIVTKLLVFISIAILLVYFAGRLRDLRLNLAVAAALMAMAALDWISHTGAVPVLWIADLGGGTKALSLLAYNFVFASEGHSIFGLTPRNAGLMLFAIAIVLRWSARPTAAACVVLFAGVLHQTYGGLAVVLFTTMTAFSRPEALRSWPVRLLLTFSVLMFVIRDRVLAVGLIPQFALATFFGLSALAAFALIQSSAYLGLRRRLLGKLQQEEVTLDAVVAVLICLFITAVAMTFAGNAEPYMRLYFWSDLATRIWSFARFPVFVAVAFGLLRLLPVKGPAVPIALCTVTIVLSGLALLQVDRTPQWAGPRPLGAALADSQPPLLTLPADEATVYARLLAISSATQPETGTTGRLLRAPIRCFGEPK
jgi:hypothetical protein